MPKFFNICTVYFVFVLISLYFQKFWTFLVLICVLFLVLIIVKLIEIDRQHSVRKPGTISNSKCYIVSKKIVKPKECSLVNKGSINKRFNKVLVSKKLFKNDTSFRNSSNSSTSFCDQISMSFLKSNSSVSSVGQYDSFGNSSPVRRQPLRSRNNIDNGIDGVTLSPVRTSVRDCSDTDLNRSTSNVMNETSSPNEKMSVGEFPLISLVSSLHEAVSPKTHRLKPSPVTIRIQPVQSPETQNDCQIDPVVAVLKQISSNKRILAPSIAPQLEEEYQEKRHRSMPRHDLTHSLLESQLTINAPRETTSKREREETPCPVSSPGGTISGTAPKRICARSVRSNEILSSLSSSICLSSPPSNKSFTGKRKSVTFDKYKKIRKIDDESYQDSSASNSPRKVDKAVSAEVTAEPSPLPIINIKRDEISERVVSRAMVSALLRSAVAKLIMSGDPAVYPVPNGSQPRQPEVTLPEFGPPKTHVETQAVSPISCSTSFAPAIIMPSKPLLTSVSTSQPSSGFNFGLQQTSGASLVPTQTVTTTSVQSSSGSSLVQTSPSLTKPQVSTIAVPNFGLSATTSVAPTTTPSMLLSSSAAVATTSTPPAFGLPTVTSSSPNFGQTSTAPPIFGQASSLPSTGFNFGTSTTTSLPSSISLTSASTINPPSFGSIASTPITTKITTFKPPSFGLTTIASTIVPSTSTTPSTFSFGNSLSSSSLIKSTTAATVAPSMFSSVVTTSSALPNLNQPTTTAPTNIFGTNLASNLSGGASGGSFFGTGQLGDKSTTDTSKVTAVFNPLASVSSANITTSGNVITSTPLFNSANSLTSTSTKPIFGAEATVATTNTIFGAALTSNKPLFGTNAQSSTPLFGANSSVTTSNIFGGAASTTVSAPVFGANTLSTTAPIFGTSTTTTTPSNPVFGSFSNPTTTAPSNLFGGINAGNSTTSASAPIFGATNPPTNPIFGSNPATTTTSSNIFGGVTNTTTPLFTSTSTAVATTTPLFGASTTSASSASIFGVVNTTATTTTTSAPTFGATAFGGSSTVKPSESLFGMPSSNSGFKASSPFQVSGGGDSATPAFYNTSTPVKPFESAAPKPASGGFTFTGGGSNTWAPFGFSGDAVSTNSGQTSGSSPFVFGSSSALNSTSNNNPTQAAVKPFQFGNAPAAETFGNATPAPSAAPSFGQSFPTTFAQTVAGNIQPAGFGQPSSPAPGAFQFNATQPAVPGSVGGLFSIGTGSSGTRPRDRRERRRR